MLDSTKQLTPLKVLTDVLNSDDEKFNDFYNEAVSVTNRVFGKVRILFNPIYVSNICLADCSYCGYRISNKGLKRDTLKPTESIREAEFLKNRGIDNILVLAGDYKHDKYLEMLLANLKAIKQSVNPKWLGVEVATLEVSEYEKLRQTGAESVTVFQETYNRKRYQELHLNPKYKGDFDFRFNAQERAIQAGIEEVGLGVLYGIGFWKEDTIEMAKHAKALQRKYPKAKLRFSFPRLQISIGQSEECKTEEITEQKLLRAIVGIRLLFPDSSIVLTGRESIEFLTEHASIVNILGYNGATSVGGYSINKNGALQFELNGQNTFSEFVDSLLRNNYVLYS